MPEMNFPPITIFIGIVSIIGVGITSNLETSDTGQEKHHQQNMWLFASLLPAALLYWLLVTEGPLTQFWVILLCALVLYCLYMAFRPIPTTELPAEHESIKTEIVDVINETPESAIAATPPAPPTSISPEPKKPYRRTGFLGSDE